MTTPPSAPVSGMGTPETPRDWASLAKFLEEIVSIQPDFAAMTQEECARIRAGMHDSLHTIFALRDTPQIPGDEGVMKNPLFNQIDSATWLSGEALRGIHTILSEAWMLTILRWAPENRPSGHLPNGLEQRKKDLQDIFRKCEFALVIARLRLALSPEALRPTDTIIVEVEGRARRVLLGDDPR